MSCLCGPIQLHFMIWAFDSLDVLFLRGTAAHWNKDQEAADSKYFIQILNQCDPQFSGTTEDAASDVQRRGNHLINNMLCIIWIEQVARSVLNCWCWIADESLIGHAGQTEVTDRRDRPVLSYFDDLAWRSDSAPGFPRQILWGQVSTWLQTIHRVTCGTLGKKMN